MDQLLNAHARFHLLTCSDTGFHMTEWACSCGTWKYARLIRQALLEPAARKQKVESRKLIVAEKREQGRKRGRRTRMERVLWAHQVHLLSHREELEKLTDEDWPWPEDLSVTFPDGSSRKYKIRHLVD
jgi:hypothetical protein